VWADIVFAKCIDKFKGCHCEGVLPEAIPSFMGEMLKPEIASMRTDIFQPGESRLLAENSSGQTGLFELEFTNE
jgi:hypothetical protein